MQSFLIPWRFCRKIVFFCFHPFLVSVLFVGPFLLVVNFYRMVSPWRPLPAFCSCNKSTMHICCNLHPLTYSCISLYFQHRHTLPARGSESIYRHWHWLRPPVMDSSNNQLPVCSWLCYLFHPLQFHYSYSWQAQLHFCCWWWGHLLMCLYCQGDCKWYCWQDWRVEWSSFCIFKWG